MEKERVNLCLWGETNAGVEGLGEVDNSVCVGGTGDGDDPQIMEDHAIGTLMGMLHVKHCFSVLVRVFVAPERDILWQSFLGQLWRCTKNLFEVTQSYFE